MVGSTLVGPPPPVEMSKKQVMRVSTQDVHRERPSLHHSTTSPAASPDRTKTFKTDHAPKISEDSTIPFSPPTPISPPTAQPPQPEAGPSQPPLAHARPIPPPPNPRKHRSGVLMSRVRANSSAPAFQTGFQMTASKSWGDLSVMGVTRACPTQDIQADGPGRPRERTGPQEGGKRIFSDGSRRGSDELDDSLWDNSARFYHHLHSRPVSRSASRSSSPSYSPVSPGREVSGSSSTSPSYVRRSLTLPQNGPGPPGPSSASSLSPNHIFLQQHLPPTFPFLGSSAEMLETESLPTHPMVILTPTTQGWRELREIQRLEGDEIDSDEGSESDSGPDGRRSSSASEGHPSRSSSMLLRFDSGSTAAGATSKRPPLRGSLSADYLGEELRHTPDPGSPSIPPDEEGESPDRPVFKPIIIAPSPVMPGDEQVPVQPDTPTRGGARQLSPVLTGVQRSESPDQAGDGTFSFSVFGDGDEGSPIGEDDSPVRFASIGRRESLRVSTKPEVRPGVPRTKTKRELERERLFKDLDDNIEAEGIESKDVWGGGVQEIGKGAGLEPRPSTADAVLEGRSGTHSEIELAKTGSLPIAPKPVQYGIRHAFRPSPLHASPLTVTGRLPTPGSPSAESSSPAAESPRRTPSPAQSAKLASLRDFARSLISPHPSHVKEKSRPSTPSPPKSPRSRRRDSPRVSLVAGRVVQPYAVPASTALPPDGSSFEKPSLQSFSPFRSPSSNATKFGRSPFMPPSFNRLDSTISLAPSIGAPSEPTTPTSETAGGVGGRGIDDYVILKEAGKGAYGLVMRAKVKGPRGDPVGEEVIIKYIIKARILADCWKKHKSLGPIPVEIHVMDQLRHLLYNPPKTPLRWSPFRPRAEAPVQLFHADTYSAPNTPDSAHSSPSSERSSSGLFSPTQKYIAAEIRYLPERGHPNICKLLDFFEDREFYYLVMPRFGTGVDLFDRVESQPAGLEPFEVRTLLGQLADAVRFLHLNGIVHRDIKDENVILDGSGKCQLIDFGSAAHWRPGKRWDTFSGTLHYASPEILRGEMYGGKEQDVWALGVVGYVLLVGETPFSDLPDEVLEGLHADSRSEVALEARCGGLNLEEGAEGDGGGRLGDAADLVRRCLEMETGDRPTAEMVCQHRYLRGEGGWVGRRGWAGGGFK